MRYADGILRAPGENRRTSAANSPALTYRKQRPLASDAAGYFADHPLYCAFNKMLQFRILIL